MKSGLRIIFNDLKFAAEQGADIKVLTGDYLYITQPEALKRLLELDHENVEIRLWQSGGISFHPKSFIFKHKEDGALIVGSSNMSGSALSHGIEWNLRMKRKASKETFESAVNQFVYLFYAEETLLINDETVKLYQERYDKFYAKHVNLTETWTKQEEIRLTLPEMEAEQDVVIKEDKLEYQVDIKPRQAQIEALESLQSTMDEDYSKAMVVMATGLGKTYLAAMFAEQFKRILFIAHRQEIIKQAKDSFELVLQREGGLLYGLEKNVKHDMIFASIFTLSIQEQLYEFEPDYFDLIVVDEFHHAAAKSYERVIDYFEPKFMLGLTATPERTDGQDVFAICDGNVAYEITFIEAIQRGWLAPFTYYGVKDDIDYSQIKWLGTRYDKEELLTEQLNEQRADHIYQKWQKYKKTRSLGFCSSIEQANFLAEYFEEQGVEAISLTSESKNIEREQVIEQLNQQAIDIIFTVDLFNEGVDIPAVDTLLFARPTESMVVFTQQIGRGLRKSPKTGKEKCVIIDLIGNYRSADTKLQVFHQPGVKQRKSDVLPIVPETCDIYLETEVIDLMKHLRKKRSPRKERIHLDYLYVKENLGRRPRYYEVHLRGKENSKEYRQAFGGYFSFLNEYGELNASEQRVYERYYRWLQKIEKENMTKSYKMVVLQYLLEKGPENWFEKVTPEEVAPYFHQYYMKKGYRKRIDFSNKSNQKLWEYDEKGVANLIARMPMTKWLDDDHLITFDNNKFQINFPIAEEDREILHQMTEQICEFKLKTYFNRRGQKEL